MTDLGPRRQPPRPRRCAPAKFSLAAAWRASPKAPSTKLSAKSRPAKWTRPSWQGDGHRRWWKFWRPRRPLPLQRPGAQGHRRRRRLCQQYPRVQRPAACHRRRFAFWQAPSAAQRQAQLRGYVSQIVEYEIEPHLVRSHPHADGDVAAHRPSQNRNSYSSVPAEGTSRPSASTWPRAC